MKVKAIKLTETEKGFLLNKQFIPDNFFGPFQDIDGNWCISEIEQKENINPNFWWLKTYEVVEVELPVTII